MGKVEDEECCNGVSHCDLSRRVEVLFSKQDIRGGGLRWGCQLDCWNGQVLKGVWGVKEDIQAIVLAVTLLLKYACPRHTRNVKKWNQGREEAMLESRPRHERVDTNPKEERQ